MSMCNRTCFYVRDNALIGDFKDAVETAVWRMDLSRVHAVAFKVVQNGPHWDLGMEGPKGEFTPVASYTSPDKAKRALRRVACAMRHRGWGRRLVNAVMILLLLAVAYGVLTFIFFPGGFLPTSATVGAAGPVAAQQGQSTSADAALRPPMPPGLGTLPGQP
jgi:hypothetical protein